MSDYPPKIDCFVCGHTKGESNRWFLVDFAETYVELKRRPDLDDLTISHFSTTGRGKPTCGSNCTQTLVERWIQTGSLEPPREDKKGAVKK